MMMTKFLYVVLPVSAFCQSGDGSGSGSGSGSGGGSHADIENIQTCIGGKLESTKEPCGLTPTCSDACTSALSSKMLPSLTGECCDLLTDSPDTLKEKCKEQVSAMKSRMEDFLKSCDKDSDSSIMENFTDCLGKKVSPAMEKCGVGPHPTGPPPCTETCTEALAAAAETLTGTCCDHLPSSQPDEATATCKAQVSAMQYQFHHFITSCHASGSGSGSGSGEEGLRLYQTQTGIKLTAPFATLQFAFAVSLTVFIVGGVVISRRMSSRVQNLQLDGGAALVGQYEVELGEE